MENVAAFARGYGRPVLEAFVAAGFLTDQEAKQRPEAAPSLRVLSDQELVDEVLRRMRERGDDGGDTAATNDDNVRPLSRREQMQQKDPEAAQSTPHTDH